MAAIPTWHPLVLLAVLAAAASLALAQISAGSSVGFYDPCKAPTPVLKVWADDVALS